MDSMNDSPPFEPPAHPRDIPTDRVGVYTPPINDDAVTETTEEQDRQVTTVGPTDIVCHQVMNTGQPEHSVSLEVAGAAQQHIGFVEAIAAALAPVLQIIDNSLQRIETHARNIDSRFQRIETHLQNIDNRLQGIETRAQDIDSRLELIEGHAGRVNNRLTNLELHLDAIQSNVNDARRQLPGIGRQQVVIAHGVENIDTRVGRVENGVLGLRTDLIGVRNQQIRAHNRRVHDRSVANGLRYGTRIQPLIKADAQLGAGIPGMPPVQPPVVQVGDAFPSPPFPATLAEISNWKLPQIHAVAVMVNSDFGIVPGDTVDECRVKLVRFLTDLV